MALHDKGKATATAAGLWAGFALGGAAGFLFWGFEPTDLHHYREVRDYARSAFVRNLGDEEILDRALHGMAHSLDQYSQYYDAREAEQLERETAGRYSGLGVAMKRPFREGRILFPLRNSPAEASGLRVGDRFVKIAGREFGELDELSFHAIVAGPEPKRVPITVVGLDGSAREVDLTTGSVVEPTVRHERIVDAGRGVGYVAITSFSHETPSEFFSAFDRLRAEGMRALVLDLRANPGGVLLSAVEIAQRFLPEGVIVSTEGRGAPIIHAADRSQAVWAGFPIVVLVDEGSASASEVLASALHDHRAAVLVGSPTYGKGLVQTIHRFPDTGAVLKVTSSYYYTPTHKNLGAGADRNADSGIHPDLRVDVGDEEKSAIHEHILMPSPPPELAAEIVAWERAEKVTLFEPHPHDPQLAAAIDLFAGKRPGPHPTREAP